MRQHHAFWHAKRAGSIDDGSHILRSDSILMRLQCELALLVDFDGNHQSTQGHHAFHGIESELFGTHRHLVKDRLHLFMNKGTFLKDHLGLGMVENMFVVALAGRWINGHQDSANLLSCEIHHVPLGAVVGNHHHTVALANAQTNQSLANHIGHFHKVAADVFFPCSVHLTRKHDFLLAIFLNKPWQEVESTGRYVGIGLNGFSFIAVLFHIFENCCENKNKFPTTLYFIQTIGDFLNKQGDFFNEFFLQPIDQE